MEYSSGKYAVRMTCGFLAHLRIIPVMYVGYTKRLFNILMLCLVELVRVVEQSPKCGRHNNICARKNELTRKNDTFDQDG